jgi:tetratricopeptide (TPR) repeat protein
MQSHFSSQTLAEIFRDFYLSERSGVLSLAHDQDEKRLFFQRGLIHYAEGNADEESLGPRLIRENKISSGALEEARGEIERPVELAQVLIRRDLIGKEALRETVREMVDSVVKGAFRWERGAAQFDDVQELAGPFESDVLTTFEVILRGIFNMTDFEPIGEAMQGLDNRLHVRNPTPLPLEKLTLSPAHGFILSRVDGSTTVSDVVSILPQAEEQQALRFLFGLLVMGVLEYDPPLGDGPFRVANILRDHADRRALERMQEQTIQQAYSQMRAQDPYSILGVTATASRQAVERAYEEAKALFSRERILPRVRDQFRSELAVIESRLIEAYLRLTQPDASKPSAEKQAAEATDQNLRGDDLLVRVEMDKTKSKLELEEAAKVADAYFAKARKAQREADFHNAIQYGKLAVSYNKNDARYFYLLAECQVRNPGPRWQHEAEQNYVKATQLDPWNADYWISLGRFYKKRGLSLRARRQFEEALRLVPEHEGATKELETL